MRTNIETVQIIVSLLKQYNIQHIVISPGTRHYPLAHLCETDNYFHCYSVVDERSAAFFALGLSESLDRPVCVVCTSSTASCNYMPAMQEAYERGIQLVALTSDKGRYQRFHGISQVIDQVDMFRPFCRYAVDVPIVNNKDDYWYCNRCVNEALLETNHHGKGPVQINFIESVGLEVEATFDEGEVPVTRKIERYETINWPVLAERLTEKNRILVICGQYYNPKADLSSSLEGFRKKYNAIITYDGFSNVFGNEFIKSPFPSISLNSEEISSLTPDLIITYGTKVFSSIIGRFYNKGIEHWDINPEGRVYDSTKNLSLILECTPMAFFENLSKLGDSNDGLYATRWKQIESRINRTTPTFSNYYAAKEVLQRLPSASLVHASVLNSMKFVNLLHLPQGALSFGNIGADGIDGALSTFLGQAACSDALSLLLIGDLSFLYDLNAAKYITNPKLRILLINNHAGAEFHYNIGIEKIPTLDLHIAASHQTDVKQTLGLMNLDYLPAKSKEEFDRNINTFIQPSEKPILMEVFTDSETDANTLKDLYASNHIKTRKEQIAYIVQKVVGGNITRKLKRIING